MPHVRASRVLAAALLVLLPTACGKAAAKPSFDELPLTTALPAPPETPSAPPEPPPATATPTATPLETVVPSATPSTNPAEALVDGRHPAYLTAVDAQAGKVTLDLVQFFTGTAAAQAAGEDGAAEVPPPNDYWIRNRNTQLRTLTVDYNATITVNTLAAEETGNSRKDVTVTLAKLGSYPSLANRMFWITVSGGAITALTEQFLP
ncbi:MAG: hypothetical protein ACT4QG_10140 [Sporichthyaceae bacterium]